MNRAIYVIIIFFGIVILSCILVCLFLKCSKQIERREYNFERQNIVDFNKLNDSSKRIYIDV